jgi:hypothetical protein
MTTLEWLAFFVLLAAALSAAAATILAGGATTRALRRLEKTYRRQKGLELEQLQARAVRQRRGELNALLAQPDGWLEVLGQLVADALPETEQRMEGATVLDLSAAPVPRFTVGSSDGATYLFTTSPEALRRVKVLGRKDEALPLDASLHPAARVEVQAVWDHLAAKRLRGEAPALPRQAQWFLVVREGRQ